MIRQIELQDAEAICEIYNYYILNSTATFETEVVSRHSMKKRIKSFNRQFPWLVYEKNGEVTGYAYATAWRKRVAYKHSVETSVYVKNGFHGKGIGSRLYKTLFHKLKELNIHVIIGGVTLPNENSILLHEKFGFKKVAHFKEVGFKFGQWRDVGYWQVGVKKLKDEC